MVPPDLLHCIAVTDAEYDASLSAGSTRILVRLGLSKHWYPCPPYIDRGCKSCITLEEVKRSIPGGGSPVNAKGLAAYRERSQVVLEVPTYARLSFQEEVLAANLQRVPSFWIHSDIHETCDSAYVWRADGDAPNILCARAGVTKRIAAGFLLFCPSQRRNNVRLFGDGFLILVDHATWEDFQSAITRMSNFEFIGIDNLSFKLTWNTQDHQLSSIISLVSSLMTCPPAVGRMKEKKKEMISAAEMSFTRFVQEPRLGDSSPEMLVELTKQIKARVEALIPQTKPAQSPDSCTVVVQFCVPPPRDRPWLFIAVNPPAAIPFIPLTELYEAFDEINIPENAVYRGVAEIQLYFSLWGAEPPTGTCALMPDDVVQILVNG